MVDAQKICHGVDCKARIRIVRFSDLEKQNLSVLCTMVRRFEPKIEALLQPIILLDNDPRVDQIMSVVRNELDIYLGDPSRGRNTVAKGLGCLEMCGVLGTTNQANFEHRRPGTSM